MVQNKKGLLIEQANKINEVIDALSKNFAEEDVADEVNFLAIVRDNLKVWAEK